MKILFILAFFPTLQHKGGRFSRERPVRAKSAQREPTQRSIGRHHHVLEVGSCSEGGTDSCSTCAVCHTRKFRDQEGCVLEGQRDL